MKPGATTGEISLEMTPSWRLRVAIGLAIATVVGLLSLATTASAVDAAGPDQIVVQASGATGEEEMLLRVNGVETARWRVAKSSQSYEHVVATTLEVKTVEVAFLNDNGPRDLTVNRIDLGGVVLQSTAPGTTSSGTYVSNDGGCRDRASVSTKLHCNGAFTYDVPAGVVLSRASEGPVVNVRAIGRSGGEQLQIRINNKVVASASLGTKWQVVTARLPKGTAVSKAEVQFVNDGASRDLRVDYLEIDGRRFESESADTIALGTYSSASGCAQRASSSEWLHCSGWFRYNVTNVDTPRPPSSTTTTTVAPGSSTTTTTVAPGSSTTTTTVPPVQGDEVVIRALGRSGKESMQLRVNGKAVDSWTVGTSFRSYRSPIADAADVTRIEVQFVNDASGRDLRVDYIELAGKRFQSESTTTRSKGTYSTQGGCAERNSTSEWLHCSGWFSYAVSDTPQPPVDSGRYSINQVIDGTIGAGDGSNPNEEAPMGRHEAPLYLPQGWNWAQGPTRNSVWGQLGSGGSKYAEFRCAVIPENGHRPSVPFRINVRNGAYYQFANNAWNKAFDVDLTGGNHGGYLGQAGRLNSDPFSSGSHGQIQWRRESDGSYSAPWNSSALMMHFWAGKRQSPASGQTAEFLTSEVRLQQPDGKTVDLSKIKVLFQCGIDYYNTTGGQGTKVPGPGIAKYHRVTTNWRPGLWVTLPGNAPANSVSDFRTWLQRNTPPNVGS